MPPEQQFSVRSIFFSFTINLILQIKQRVLRNFAEAIRML